MSSDPKDHAMGMGQEAEIKDNVVVCFFFVFFVVVFFFFFFYSFMKFTSAVKSDL